MKDWKVFLFPGFIILCILFGYISLQMTNNHLVSLETRIEADKKKLDSAEITRAKLYGQLGSLLESAVIYDKTIVDEIAHANTILASGDINAAAGAFGRIIQTYPDLAAVDGFRNLRDTIELTEKNCQSLRDALTESQEDYKTDIRSFPYTLAMQFFNYKIRDDLISDDYSGYVVPETKNEVYNFGGIAN